ncbi:MAG: transposase [Spirochaetaceae bacterium]|nr:transposase [Spirochaetaceae bacterium]
MGRTYKGCDGYAPIISYIGSEGYMLNCELRPGTQHCQKGTPEYLKKNLTLIEKLAPSDPILIRMDSGNDAFTSTLCSDTKRTFLSGKAKPETGISYAVIRHCPIYGRT